MTQIYKLNVPPAIANLSASFGATIGQNGCAGIYLQCLQLWLHLQLVLTQWTSTSFNALIAIITDELFRYRWCGWRCSDFVTYRTSSYGPSCNDCGTAYLYRATYRYGSYSALTYLVRWTAGTITQVAY
ncbi:hypothetical protein OH492_27005 [Vibrio chagasii]|nr:hypothetical protein [Vibrio chagasii]